MLEPHPQFVALVLRRSGGSMDHGGGIGPTGMAGALGRLEHGERGVDRCKAAALPPATAAVAAAFQPLAAHDAVPSSTHAGASA